MRELDTVLGHLRAALVYEAFFERIGAAGGRPLVAWPGDPDAEGLAADADAVLLIGGGDVEPERFGLDAEGDAVDRRRDEFESRLVLAARERGLPVLGVCRGAQVVNVALGGTLHRVEGHRQETDLREPAHPVDVAEGTRLAGVVGTDPLDVNSFHNWAVDALAPGVCAVAHHGDVVEAFESDGEWWALGVQWHLELLDDPTTQRIFDAHVAAAAEGR